MKKLSLLTLIFLYSFGLQAQAFKNSFEVGGGFGISPNIFFTLPNLQTYGKNKSLSSRRRVYNFQQYIGYNRLVSDRIGIGFRITNQISQFQPDKYSIYQENFPIEYNNTNVGNLIYNISEISGLNARQNSFLFNIKFAPRYTLLPFGFEQNFFFGPSFVKVTNSEVRVEYSRNPYYNQIVPNEDQLPQTIQVIDIETGDSRNSDNQKYLGAVIGYSAELNYPITDNQLISFGFEMNIELLMNPRESLGNNIENLEPIVQDDEIVREMVNSTNFKQDISLRYQTALLYFKFGYKIAF